MKIWETTKKYTMEKVLNHITILCLDYVCVSAFYINDNHQKLNIEFESVKKSILA